MICHHESTCIISHLSRAVRPKKKKEKRKEGRKEGRKKERKEKKRKEEIPSVVML